MPPLKLATFNINNVAKRLSVLLERLAKASPDVVCLQELKVPNAGFPLRQIEAAGYGARWVGEPSWNGVAILARGMTPIETRRQLPGDPSDKQSRYLEAAAHGVIVGCLYAPNGNPQPGPKFAYKLAWMERLLVHAQALHETGHPVVLAGDYNVGPHRPRHLQHAVVAEERAPSTRAARRLPEAARSGLDRRDPGEAPRRAHLHLLGLPAARVGTERRPAPGSHPAQRLAGRGPAGRRL
jgi:exodeoxyribonuclease III